MTDKPNPFRVCLGCGSQFEISTIDTHQGGCVRFRKDNDSKDGWQTMGDLGADYSYWTDSRMYDWPPERWFLVVQMRELAGGRTECRWKDPHSGACGPPTLSYETMIKDARNHLQKKKGRSCLSE